MYRPDRAPRVPGDAGVLAGEDVLPGFRLPLRDLWATVAEEYREDDETGPQA